VIPHCVDRYRVFAHNFANSCVGMENDTTKIPYWRDAGTIDAYWEANMELTKVTPELNLYDDDWPIWTHQEQLPPAKFVFDDDGRRGMAVDSLVSGGDIISGATGAPFAAVFASPCAQLRADRGLGDPARCRYRPPRQAAPGGDGQALPDSRGHADRLRRRRADRKRFHVSDNGITLVTPDMLGPAGTSHIR
jgi:glucose-1-phosphate adenylyltransferase